VDFSKLSTTDKIIAGSGAVLFIASFLPWFKASVEGFGSTTANGWDLDFIWGTLPALLGLLSAFVVLATKLGNMKMPEMPASTGQIMLGVGVLAAFLVVLKLLIGEDGNSFVDVDRAWGLFVATIAALGLAYGGFQSYREGQRGPSAV
jgi:hypothetical protein